MTNFTLNDLEQRVRERATDSATFPTPASCSTRAWRIAPRSSAREAIETVLAAAGESRERLISETADVLYHLLVVLKARDVTLADVETELAARTARSGLDEKAARKSGN